MSEEPIVTYSIERKRKREFILGGCFLILISLFLALLSFLIPGPVPNKAIALMFYAIPIVLGIGCVWYPLLIHISLSENGITFKRPFFSLSCAWQDIDCFRFYKQGICILPNHNVRVSSTKVFGRIFATRDNEIPLFLFHEPPDRKGRIKGNAVLRDIEKYRSKYASEV